jgi:hypothetical protein
MNEDNTINPLDTPLWISIGDWRVDAGCRLESPVAFRRDIELTTPERGVFRISASPRYWL